MEGLFPLILGMTAVTYLPRLIPLIMLNDRPIHPKLERFLLYIPFTSLTILIGRGVMETEAEMLLPTLIGLSVSAIVSWTRENLVLSVLTGILASFLVLNVLG